MNAKHTPGPWKLVPSGNDRLFIADAVAPDTTTEARYRFVAEAFRFHTERRVNPLWNWPSAQEEEANARLIAAAPELLEACRQMLRWFGNCGSPAQQEASDKCRNAIAKAEGSAE